MHGYNVIDVLKSKVSFITIFKDVVCGILELSWYNSQFAN